MHRIARLFGLAATVALVVASLTAGAAFAAGSPVVGHVYVNNNSAGHNTIAGFNRHADGTLTPIAGSPFNAGGAGTGAPFGSAGGLQETADGRYLLATDPGSNEISVLRIKPNGALRLVEVQDVERPPSRRASRSTAASSTSRTAAPAAATTPASG